MAKQHDQLRLAAEIAGQDHAAVLRICMSYKHVGLAYYFNMISDDVAYNTDKGKWMRYVGPNWEEDEGNTVLSLIDIRVTDKLDLLVEAEKLLMDQLQAEVDDIKVPVAAAREAVKTAEKDLKQGYRLAAKNVNEDSSDDISRRKNALTAAAEELAEQEQQLGIKISEVRAQKRLISQMTKEINKYREAAGRNNLLAVAATSINTRRVTSDMFDADTSYLCCQNTVLRFGKKGLITEVEPSPDLLLQKKLGCDYVRGARNTKWLAALREICGDDDDTTPERSQAAFLLRLLGAALAGKGDLLRHGPILYGEGAQNGKDVVINKPMMAVFGTYAMEHDSALLMREQIARSATSANPLILSLPALRLVIMREIEKGGVLSVKKYKELTGGGTANGRDLHSSKYGQRPIIALVMLTTNDPPLISHSDAGTQLRMSLVPFPYSFVDEPDLNNKWQKKRDVDLEEQIKEDLPGILNLLIEGWQDWMAGNRQLRVPLKVSMQTKEFFHEIDELAPWIEARVTHVDLAANPNWRIDRTDAYRNYSDWYGKLTGRKAMTSHMFTRLMRSKGFTPENVGGKIWFYGINISETDIQTK